MTLPPGIRSVLRNFIFLFGSQMLATLIGGAYAVFLARLLGPELYGTLTYGFSWYLTLITLTSLGLDVVLGREVGRDRATAPALAGSTLALRAIAAAVIALLSAGIALAVEPDPAARQLLLVLSVALLGRAIWLWCGSVFVAFENTRQLLAIDIAFRPMELGVTILILSFFAPKSILAIGIVHATLWWLQASFGIVIILKRLTRVHFHDFAGHAWRLVREGVPGVVYMLAVAWFLQSPIVLFRQVAGVGDALGHFGLAIQMTGYLLTIPYLVGSVALPVLSRSASRDDGKTRAAAIAMLVTIPVVGVVLGVLGLWLAPPLTAFIFGADYLQAGHILGEAIWLLTPISLAIGLQQILFSRRLRLKMASLSAILGVVSMAALYAPLTRALSYHGALLATGIGMSLWAGGLVMALVLAGMLAKPVPDAARAVQGRVP